MAIVLGKKARVYVGSSPAVVGHIIGDISYKMTDTLVETTASDSATRTYVPTGLKECSLSFSAQFDAADAPQDALRTNANLLASGTPVTVPVILYPEGVGSTLTKWSGSLCMESMEISANTIDGVVQMAFTFKGAPLLEEAQT